MSRQIEQRRKQRKLKRLFPSDKLTLEDRHVPLTYTQERRLKRWAKQAQSNIADAPAYAKALPRSV